MLSQERKERNAKSIGSYLKEKREAAGFTQKVLADKMGLDYVSMISQMERGYISVPPALWVPLCEALDLDEAAFVARCLGEYQPELFQALFGKRSQGEVTEFLQHLKGGRP